jgi:hypothetical protein
MYPYEAAEYHSKKLTELAKREPEVYQIAFEKKRNSPIGC